MFVDLKARIHGQPLMRERQRNENKSSPRPANKTVAGSGCISPNIIRISYVNRIQLGMFIVHSRSEVSSFGAEYIISTICRFSCVCVGFRSDGSSHVLKVVHERRPTDATLSSLTTIESVIYRFNRVFPTNDYYLFGRYAIKNSMF